VALRGRDTSRAGHRDDLGDPVARFVAAAVAGLDWESLAEDAGK